MRTSAAAEALERFKHDIPPYPPNLLRPTEDELSTYFIYIAEIYITCSRQGERGPTSCFTCIHPQRIASQVYEYVRQAQKKKTDSPVFLTCASKRIHIYVLLFITLMVQKLAKAGQKPVSLDWCSQQKSSQQPGI